MKNEWVLKGYDTVNHDAVYQRPAMRGILKLSKACQPDGVAPNTVVLEAAILGNPKAAPKVKPTESVPTTPPVATPVVLPDGMALVGVDRLKHPLIVGVNGFRKAARVAPDTSTSEIEPTPEPEPEGPKARKLRLQRERRAAAKKALAEA